MATEGNLNLFVKTYGDPYEVGKQHGEAFAETIRELVAEAGVPGRFEGPEYDERLALMRANFERLAPELLAEIEGIADGAGLSFERVLKFNVLPEVKRAGGQAGCSLVGFEDAPGGPVIAKTTDIPGGRTDRRAMIVVDVPGKAQALVLSVPGTVWGSGGVNELGVGCANAAVETSEWRDTGLPSRVMPRLLLQNASNVDEALLFLWEAEFACAPFTLMIGDEDRLVCVERSVEKVAVREPEDGVLYATNHWLTPELAELMTPTEAQIANSELRYHKLTALLADKPHTFEAAREVISDTVGPGAICQVGDDASKLVTTAAMIARPRSRVAWFAPGMPCQTELKPYQLQLPVVEGGFRVAGEAEG